MLFSHSYLIKTFVFETSPFHFGLCTSEDIFFEEKSFGRLCRDVTSQGWCHYYIKGAPYTIARSTDAGGATGRVRTALCASVNKYPDLDWKIFFQEKKIIAILGLSQPIVSLLTVTYQ